MTLQIVHVSQDSMKKMEFVLIVHINVTNVHQPKFVPFVLETVYHYPLVTVHTENLMMVPRTVKNVDTNVKLVMMNGLVPYVLDQTETPPLIVTVLQDIMKTQLI